MEGQIYPLSQDPAACSFWNPTLRATSSMYILWGLSSEDCCSATAEYSLKKQLAEFPLWLRWVRNLIAKAPVTAEVRFDPLHRLGGEKGLVSPQLQLRSQGLLGTSICCGCGHLKKKKNKNKHSIVPFSLKSENQ